MTGDRSKEETGPASSGALASRFAPLEQDFDGRSLYALRSAVAAHAAAAGLSPVRTYDVVAVAHELAANAVRHGAGHGHLRLQSDGDMLTCRVSDDGPATVAGDGAAAVDTGGDGNGSPDAGAARWPVQHGHGLWLIEQVADRFTIDRGPAGTTATAAFALRPAK